MIKRYEVIWEIFNKCSGNQMRDVHFEEVETDNPAAYVATRFKGYEITAEQDNPDGGTLIYEIMADGLRQRISLTEV